MTESAASEKPILLFLHGVGKVDRDDAWRAPLDATLARMGYPNLDSVEVIAPKYAHILKDWDEKARQPAVTIKPPTRDAARQNRRDFERRVSAVEGRLTGQSQGGGLAALDLGVSGSVDLPSFRQARNYVSIDAIRAQVLKHILSKLPSSGRLVIVGHSLGSVIAADLLRYLPVELRVDGMVTIGSPLANGRFDVDRIRDALKEPPSNLGWWVNFWNTTDLVAAHRGVSSVFPWMVDFRISTGAPMGKRAHSANEYFGADAVATAVGFALFGSLSKDLARIDKGVEIPLDTAETYALAGLRYAFLIMAGLKGDVRDRYSGALREVQATAVDQIRRRNASEGRQLPTAIARLDFDLSDPRAPVPVPKPPAHVTKDEAVAMITALASQNVVRPFEISVDREIKREAMRNLTREMRLGGQFGADVFAAAKQASAALDVPGVNLLKLGALGAGAVALAVMPGGFMLAGGMVGSLLAAGTLAAATGITVAHGLASAHTSAEALEAIVEQRLSTEILRKKQGLEPDLAAWRTLVETEMELRREYERLDEFSDESAPGLKELKRKVSTIERAIKHLRDQGLEPGIPEADEPDGADEGAQVAAPTSPTA